MIDGAETFSVRRAGARRSVASHPAFQLFVAAWFAALFGAGCLMLPAALLERLVAISGVATLVPAAAPPLGFTARATLALVGAIAGTGAGLLIARKIAQSSAPETQALSPQQDPPRCRPIHASEELPEESIAQTPRGELPQEDLGQRSRSGAQLAQIEEAPIGEHASGENRLDEQPRAPQPEAEPSFENLGLMQLTARLGAALHERRSQLAAEQATVSRAPTVRVASRPALEASDPEEAAQAVADFFASGKGAKAQVAPASRDVH